MGVCVNTGHAIRPGAREQRCARARAADPGRSEQTAGDGASEEQTGEQSVRGQEQIPGGEQQGEGEILRKPVTKERNANGEEINRERGREI